MDDFDEDDEFITGGEETVDEINQREEKDYEDETLCNLFRKGEGEDIQDPD
jgi:hypothetical protein